MLTKLSDALRIALYALLVFLLVLLFEAWDKDHPKPTVSTVTTSTTEQNDYVPSVSQPQQMVSANAQPQTITKIATANLIHVSTDTLNMDINLQGGNIVKVELPQYAAELHSKQPTVLLNNNPESRYLAQSGLLSKQGPDTKEAQAVYTSDNTNYSLASGENNLQVVLHWQNPQGVEFSKIFTFTRGSYQVGMSYNIENKSHSTWEGNVYLQLMRTNTPPESKGLGSFATYFGAAISSPEKTYQKITFKQMSQQNLDQTIQGGWAAMIQHYFVSAWVPDNSMTSHYFSRITHDGLYTIGMLGPNLVVQPGETLQTNAKFYAGPTIASKLEQVAPGLQLTIDYGWLWFISAIIFWMMQHIYNVVGNWGWSIVLVTLVIKLMFYHLSAKSYRSMSAMKKLQPRINALKERFGDDKQKFTQATLELYKKEKVNPMSGCLPILVQIPVFIGLYWVLIESVQLRHAPFILWIHDLSTKDPYYILPLLMGLSMFLQQRLNPAPPDPMQAKIMMLMPIVFTILFMNFPAGLMLYWFVNNTLSFLQQWYIMRNLETAKK